MVSSGLWRGSCGRGGGLTSVEFPGYFFFVFAEDEEFVSIRLVRIVVLSGSLHGGEFARVWNWSWYCCFSRSVVDLKKERPDTEYGRKLYPCVAISRKSTEGS